MGGESLSAPGREPGERLRAPGQRLRPPGHLADHSRRPGPSRQHALTIEATLRRHEWGGHGRSPGRHLRTRPTVPGAPSTSRTGSHPCTLRPAGARPELSAGTPWGNPPRRLGQDRRTLNPRSGQRTTRTRRSPRPRRSVGGPVPGPWPGRDSEGRRSGALEDWARGPVARIHSGILRSPRRSFPRT